MTDAVDGFISTAPRLEFAFAIKPAGDRPQIRAEGPVCIDIWGSDGRNRAVPGRKPASGLNPIFG